MNIDGPEAYYHFVLLVVLVSMALLYLIIRSPLGEVLQAIRDNSERTEFLGIQVRNYRLASFVIAGTFGEWPAPCSRRSRESSPRSCCTGPTQRSRS